MTILLIDNYDSFTYNILQYLNYFDYKVIVKRNDEITINHIQNYKLKGIVLSPGPCTPDKSGISLEILKKYDDIQLPILGICLGHQAIAQHFGCKIILGDKPMHGKITNVFHNNHRLFNNVPQKFRAARYHSLVVDKNTLTNYLSIIASSEEKTILGLAHNNYPIYGLQFHPESIGSEYGYQIFKNFLEIINYHTVR